MVKKLMAGLAISIGAGLALMAIPAAPRSRKKSGWHPATTDGTMTPVTIRVLPAVPRGDQNWTGAEPDEPLALTAAPERSAELAEIRVMIGALEQRSTERMATVNQRIDELQDHLPRFIEVKVTSRIREMEERLRKEFQDEQSRTVDAFLLTLDQKVLPRISMLEETIGAQAAEIDRMRKTIEKTDETLEQVLDRSEVHEQAVA
jgi:molecular chaperone GrpE (heat shock protein)